MTENYSRLDSECKYYIPIYFLDITKEIFSAGYSRQVPKSE